MPHTLMVISPHGDDAAAFCGGTVAKHAALGWKVVMVVVTDDRKDSVGLTVDETLKRNQEETKAGAKHLGVSELVFLDFETDTLGDVPIGKLRERFVYLFRKYQPFAVMGFDPYDRYEGNLDHLRIAQATEEAYWVSCFDLHYPEHFQEGLKPFSVCERWYFGRNLAEPNQIEDVTDHIQARVEALLCHKTAMRNLLNQYKLQLETWGKRVQLIEFSLNTDMRPLLEGFIKESTKAEAQKHKLPDGCMAESYRLVRFGALESLFQMMAEPMPGKAEPPKRSSLDAQEKK